MPGQKVLGFLKGTGTVRLARHGCRLQERGDRIAWRAERLAGRTVHNVRVADTVRFLALYARACHAAIVLFRSKRWWPPNGPVEAAPGRITNRRCLPSVPEMNSVPARLSSLFLVLQFSG